MSKRIINNRSEFGRMITKILEQPGDDVNSYSELAELLSTFDNRRKLINFRDRSRNNILHLCVERNKLNLARVIFFSLKEYCGLCLYTKNHAKKRPIDLLVGKKPEDKEFFEYAYDKVLDQKQSNYYKFLRLYVRYSPTDLEAQYPTPIERARYHVEWADDIKQILMGTQAYKIGSLISIFGFPIGSGFWAVIKTFDIREGISTVVNELLTNDLIDAIERSISLTRLYLNKNSILKVADWAAWSVGLMRHTPSRMTVMAFRELVSGVIGLERVQQLAGKNYLNYLYYGAMLYALEECICRRGVKLAAKVEAKIPCITNMWDYMYPPTPEPELPWYHPNSIYKYFFGTEDDCCAHHPAPTIFSGGGGGCCAQQSLGVTSGSPNIVEDEESCPCSMDGKKKKRTRRNNRPQLATGL